MYVSEALKANRRDEVLGGLPRLLKPQEIVRAVLPIFRMKKNDEIVVLTNERILTIHFRFSGEMFVVDDLWLAMIRGIRVSRSGFSIGRIDLDFGNGSMHLGSIQGKRSVPDIAAIERALDQYSFARHSSSTAAGSSPGTEAEGWIEFNVASVQPANELVRILSEFSDLHDRGKLTDEEFAAAKARIIVPVS